MSQELKRRRLQEVGNIPLCSGKAIVDANDIVALANQSVTKVASEKPCSAGNKNSFVFWIFLSFLSSGLRLQLNFSFRGSALMGPMSSSLRHQSY
jgi:hypothetical protein